MGIHHSGKDETRGARGWSGLRAAIDTEIEVRDAGAVKTATVLKQRDLPKGAQFNFTLQQVVLGQNERGKDVTSCVVKAASGDGFQAGLSRRSDALKGTKRHVYQCLVDAINDRPERGFGCPDDACSVPESVWRERFYRTTVGDQTPDAKRMQFRRYAATLQAEHFVAILDGRAWLVSAADEPR